MDQNEEIMKRPPTPEAVKSIDHDLLGRENIVTAISNKIKERSKNDIFCEVIGVYGKWGEGKSSVLNFVKESLEMQNKDEGIIIKLLDFNPWLFQDHESMLLDFFKILQTGFTGDELKEKLKQYGPLVALGTKGLLNLALPMFSGVTNNIIDTVVDAISNSKINIKSSKTEIDEQIKLSKTHYVIFIDDVDRLDQEELHTLFKLIKQNADFVNTTYVVSMDADMVASSIGHRFEDGSKEAGRNFLEKIVQYPVYLPKVQHSKMRNVFEKLIVTEFKKYYEAGGSPTMQPLDQLKHNLYKYIFPLFDTVREMILYKNAVSFVLPTVHREVNLSDFAMLEALKMFHKEGYKWISMNKHILIHNWDKKMNDEPEIFIEFKKILRDGAKRNAKPPISNLIEALLPPLNHAVYYDRGGNVAAKRLFSLKYFDNYFLYDLSEHKISDKVIDKFIPDISSMSADTVCDKLGEVFEVSKLDDSIWVIEQLVKQMSTIDSLTINDVLHKIVLSIVRISIIKCTTNRIIYMNYSQLLDFTSRLLYKNIEDDGAINNIVDSILFSETTHPILLEFALKQTHQEFIIDGSYKIVQGTIYSFIIRYITERGLEDLFKLNYILTVRAFMLWQKHDEAEYKRETEMFMFSDNFDLVGFMNNITPRSVPDKNFVLCKLFNMDKVYDKLKHLRKESNDENEGIRELLRFYEYEQKRKRNEIESQE